MVTELEVFEKDINLPKPTDEIVLLDYANFIDPEIKSMLIYLKGHLVGFLIYTDECWVHIVEIDLERKGLARQGYGRKIIEHLKMFFSKKFMLNDKDIIISVCYDYRNTSKTFYEKTGFSQTPKALTEYYAQYIDAFEDPYDKNNMCIIITKEERDNYLED